jgi:hypothetical protein
MADRPLHDTQVAITALYLSATHSERRPNTSKDGLPQLKAWPFATSHDLLLGPDVPSKQTADDHEGRAEL